MGIDTMCVHAYVARTTKAKHMKPSNAEATFIQSTSFWNTSKHYHVGIHWKALTEYSQMSTHLLGSQSFFMFLHRFAMDD